MNRRTFCLATGSIAATPSLLLSGCGEKKPVTKKAMPALPPFAADRLHAKLEELRLAYEAKGFAVSGTLQPGHSAEAVREQCGWFPMPLPPEIIALYAWRGGQTVSHAKQDSPFWFRDCAFSTLADAKAQYASMMSTYGAIIVEDAPLLRASFPFAAFNGGWLVLPCANQVLEPRLDRPVISVFQGISVHYFSIELMVATALDWVRHEKYSDSRLPREVELDIWNRHNPGVFAR